MQQLLCVLHLPLTPNPPRTQTDEEHDSVHARHDEKEEVKALPKSGRLMDQVKVAKLTSPPPSPPVDASRDHKPSLARTVHPYNPDEYDFWVNVGTNVVGAPSICSTSKPAPVYQVVLPRELSREELYEQEHELEATRHAAARDAGVPPNELDSPYHRLERPVRPEAVPTQCHALGSIDNVSFSVIDPKDPGHGVSLTYHGGDECLKKVMVTTRPPAPAGAPPGSASPPSEAGYLHPSWVPTPRSVSLHIRCDEADTGANDVASFLQLVKRVRVVETEMCEYVVEWPSRWGCSKAPRGSAARGRAAVRRAPRVGAPSALRPLLALVVVVVAAWQLYRQWPAIRVIVPGLMGGNKGAWRRFGGLLVARKQPLARRHSKAGHDV